MAKNTIINYTNEGIIQSISLIASNPNTTVILYTASIEGAKILAIYPIIDTTVDVLFKINGLNIGIMGASVANTNLLSIIPTPVNTAGQNYINIPGGATVEAQLLSPLPGAEREFVIIIEEY